MPGGTLTRPRTLTDCGDDGFCVTGQSFMIQIPYIPLAFAWARLGANETVTRGDPVQQHTIYPHPCPTNCLCDGTSPVCTCGTDPVLRVVDYTLCVTENLTCVVEPTIFPPVQCRNTGSTVCRPYRMCYEDTTPTILSIGGYAVNQIFDPPTLDGRGLPGDTRSGQRSLETAFWCFTFAGASCWEREADAVCGWGRAEDDRLSSSVEHETGDGPLQSSICD